MAGFLLATFYAAMVAAGLAVEFLFEALGIEPHARNAKVEMASVSWNYTTYLNIVFLVLAAALVWRYFRRGGGWEMLKAMNKPLGDEHAHHAHHHGHQARG
jgi:ABC-type nickel/cobalt efflux system permease component RcnA